MWNAIFVILVMFGVCTPAWADTPESMKAIELGNRAVEDGRYEDALGHFQSAYTITSDPKVLYRIGRIQEALGNYEGASKTLLEYLELVPDTEYADRIRAKAGRLKKRAASSQAAILLESDPALATVVDDATGKIVGKTPERIPVSPGTYSYTLTRPGYVSAQASISVGDGETVEKLVVLEKQPEEERPAVVVRQDAPPVEQPIAELATWSYVDVGPPVGLRVLFWITWSVGVVVGVGGLILAAEGETSFAPTLVGAGLVGGAGYFLWFHDWSSSLPDIEGDTSQRVIGIGVRF